MFVSNSLRSRPVEAATIDLAVVTGALGLYCGRFLPPPWTPKPLSGPLLIYGGSIIIGFFPMKLAWATNLLPIIAIAGNTLELVSSLLASTAGDGNFNYRNGPELLQRYITTVLAELDAKAVHVALDAGSWDAWASALGAEILLTGPNLTSVA